jgi:hypothetical protein
MSYKFFESLILSQFISLIVPPIEIPRICVCTAPDAATAQTSLFKVVIAGATAVGGGDLIVVVLLEVESVVLLLVESVTMGSAIAIDVVITKSTAVAIFLYMALIPVLLTIHARWRLNLFINKTV